MKSRQPRPQEETRGADAKINAIHERDLKEPINRGVTKCRHVSNKSLFNGRCHKTGPKKEYAITRLPRGDNRTLNSTTLHV